MLILGLEFASTPMHNILWHEKQHYHCFLPQETVSHGPTWDPKVPTGILKQTFSSLCLTSRDFVDIFSVRWEQFNSARYWRGLLPLLVFFKVKYLFCAFYTTNRNARAQTHTLRCVHFHQTEGNWTEKERSKVRITGGLRPCNWHVRPLESLTWGGLKKKL